MKKTDNDLLQASAPERTLSHSQEARTDGAQRFWGGWTDVSEADEDFGGAELALEVALEGLEGEAAQVLGAAAGPGLGGKGGGWRTQHALRQQPRIRGKGAGIAVAMEVAEEAITQGVEAGFAGHEGLAAGGAVRDVGQQAHQAGHPEGEIGERHPGLLDRGLVEDREQQAEDGFLGVVLGEGLVDDFSIEAENGHANVIDGRGERRTDDFQLVEADELLAGALGKPGLRYRHGFQSATEAFAALERGFGDTLDPAVVAREEAHDQVGLVDRPGAQNHGFGGEHGHGYYLRIDGSVLEPMGRLLRLL